MMIEKKGLQPEQSIELNSQFDDLLGRFNHLERVLIDTSSVLYMRKSGFLSKLAACLEISTIGEVIDEIGEPVSGIRLWKHQDEAKTTDLKLEMEQGLFDLDSSKSEGSPGCSPISGRMPSPCTGKDACVPFSSLPSFNPRLIPVAGGGTTDQKLIKAAFESGIPVVSEDRKMLKTLEEKTIPFFNSLIMLNLLFYRRQINFAELKCFERNLRKYAWYSNKIWEYGGFLTQQILSRRNRTESVFG